VSTDYKSWPYGCYLDRKFITFFDRRYRPIASGPWLEYEFPTGRLRIARDLVPVRPDAWITHDAKAHFYTDATSPTLDRRTRTMLKRMLATWPALQREIERRAGGSNWSRVEGVWA
jgi:hypothetical protein